MKQWEYRLRHENEQTNVQRVKGLMNTDEFAFPSTYAETVAWIRKYEQKMGRGRPIIIRDLYLPRFRLVPMIPI